ncbi:lysophospholipase [Methanocella sp. CWC-04]|uniref:Lysophospholipase n=2 Tax=Methanooceanicella nereidis TaxID=2052831 RepID=A0AAP2W7J2_9EURY|nr:lysophospholipase [Methanocella sp. CWC-04]
MFMPVCRHGFIEAEDGEKLFFREWSPPGMEVTSVIIFLHGIGLHSGSDPYGNRIPIKKLMDRGTTFYAFDLRGHGRSTGSMESMEPDRLIKDLDLIIDDVRSKYDRAAIYLYGHNFGGILSLYYVSENPDKVKGLIISEYSTRIKKSISKIRRPHILSSTFKDIIRMISGTSRRYKFLSGDEYRQLCNRYHIPADKNIIGSLEDSGALNKDITYGKSFFKACGVGMEKQMAKKVNIPVLMIFSTHDPFFDVKGAYDILTSFKTYVKEISLVESSGHYDIIEKGQDIVAKWLSKRLPINAA